MHAAEAPAALRAQEFALARHIRDPDANPPPPGIEDRRLRIYRELFYNNVEDLLSGNFPVIRKMLDDGDWHALVRGFFREHRCRTPLFPELPREFLQYLEHRQARGAGDPAWLLELAHYEWVELALDIDDADPATVPHDPQGDLLAGAPLPSPLAWPLAYRWPVHRLGPDFLPDTPPQTPTFLLVRRDRAHRVRFSEINGLTFRLLQRLGEFPELSGRDQLAALAAEAHAPDVEAFIAQGAAMLVQLRDSGALLGTRPAPPWSDAA
ncbi:DNA-binding domain-containing protein [Rehaibacterium terrae]|jgi:hypothetical protein|uniref:DUF2063 domain-containing protein n=1 Tax=Rehaibacterium terrae TaxID=1341696 RepID=A0A7W7Y041_9GAMM|nr:putative DNA-binding domain-containing protein [Rehaibacterium terrae]MBB5015627.1 hypothetical protein [Rehaibacterium terrae]